MNDRDISTACRAIEAGLLTPEHRERLLRSLIHGHTPLDEATQHVLELNLSSWRSASARDGDDMLGSTREQLRWAFETAQRYKDYQRTLPWLDGWDPSWSVKMIPPFGGALARFVVRLGDREVSVYFDAHGTLGAAEDYWEAYDGSDAERFCMGDGAELMAHIRDRLTNGPVERPLYPGFETPTGPAHAVEPS